LVYNILLMQSSRKSFKAFSIAEPIKR